MELDYYPHQQQSQKQQEQVQHTVVEPMATGTEEVDSSGSPMATATAAAAASTTGIINNNNINVNNNSNSNTNHSFISTSNATSVSTADAATVAIAEDMLQLHHGTALHNNNCNSNSSSASNNFMEQPAVSDSPPIGMNTPPAHTSSLNDHSVINNANSSPTNPPDNAVGSLKFEQELLYITETLTVIGRNSSTSNVHFHVAENNLVSRKHFQVIYDPEARDFWVQCLSKNGIFVDDFLQRRNADPLKLPQRCFFRFPSTEIRIQFESFVYGGSESNHRPSGGQIRSNVSRALINNHYQSSGVQMTGNGSHVVLTPSMPDSSLSQQQESMAIHQHNMMGTMASSGNNPPHLYPIDSYTTYSPLKISIPNKKDQKSPYLSPTGTISAANSCPASPRQGFHQNQVNYNNYSNNNLQNQDMFQTPSTASYNQNEKPPYSYAQLIVQAISAAPDKQLTLSGIYTFIIKHYPYYRKETNKGWQNSIRHNLSLNRYFIKVARSQDEPGKGSFWRIDPDSGAKLIDHSYKKRRQRSNQSFRPSLGMPRSAPVSPSHIDNFADNSRESSPLQDIVSAPGSPGISLDNRAVEVDLMYNTQNVHQQPNSSNNSQNNHYNSGSPYYDSNTNSVVVCMQPGQQPHSVSGGGGSNNNGNGVGALIALKRNRAMLTNTSMTHQQQLQHQQQQQQQLHPDIIYEEIPPDYSGNMESGDDECDSAKRPKYISEVL